MITAINATNGRSPGTQNVRPGRVSVELERKRASTGHTSSAFFLQRGKHGGIKEKERDRSRERSHEGIGEFSFLLWTDGQMAKESERYCYRVG